MSGIPRDPAPDATLALLREGYEFVPNRCRRLGADAFETRLMLTRAVCASGPDAARMFYHPGRFTRVGAMPPTALRLLQDKGSVSQLDAAAHRHRKAMFLGVLDADGVRRLVERFVARWHEATADWVRADRVELLPAAEGVLCRAACDWAGVPLTGREAAARTREFAAMIDGAGAVGPRMLRGLILRRRTERWAGRLIAGVRAGVVAAADGSPLRIVADHKDTDGRPLSVEAAAVELINLLRPTVAVARYVTFAALALHEYPDCVPAVRDGSDDDREAFAHEVRRIYPFFPVVGGRVREPFDWHGRPFAAGEWVLFDLYGTNRDPRVWGDPEAFRPARFAGRAVGPHELVPQGGGDLATDHRCPGERATVEIVKAAGLLAADVRCRVPDQDFRIDMSRIPACPKDRFVTRWRA